MIVGAHDPVGYHGAQQYCCGRCGAVWDTDDNPPKSCIVVLEHRVPYGKSPAQIAMREIDALPDLPKHENGFADIERTSLVEFAELKGYKLGPWLKQQLAEIEEVGRRGLSDKG